MPSINRFSMFIQFYFYHFLYLHSAKRSIKAIQCIGDKRGAACNTTGIQTACIFETGRLVYVLLTFPEIDGLQVDPHGPRFGPHVGCAFDSQLAVVIFAPADDAAVAEQRACVSAASDDCCRDRACCRCVRVPLRLRCPRYWHHALLGGPGPKSTLFGSCPPFDPTPKILPMPSCPWSFLPQQTTAPVSSSAQV